MGIKVTPFLFIKKMFNIKENMGPKLASRNNLVLLRVLLILIFRSLLIHKNNVIYLQIIY